MTAQTVTEKTLHFTSPIAFQFYSDRNIPCDSVTITVPIEKMVSDIYKVSLMLEKTCFFKGIVDKQRITFSQTGKLLTLECRSLSALLLDNEVKPSIYFQLTDKQVISQYGVPFGLKGHRFPYSVKQNFLQTKKGDSCWNVITEFCRLTYGKTPYVTYDNYVTLNPFTETTHTLSNSLSYGISYTSLTLLRAPSKLFSKVYMKTATETYSYYYGFEMENPLAVNQSVRRERYYHPISKLTANAKAEVSRLINQSNQNSFSVEVIVPSFSSFRVGDSVIINDSTYENHRLYIHSLKFVGNKKGITTTLILKEKALINQ